MVRTLGALLVVTACGDGGGGAGGSASSGSSGVSVADATSSTAATAAVSGAGAGGAGAGGAGAGGAGGYATTVSLVTESHRFIDGQMFGGWGPHLGHLVRAGAAGDLYFVDDVCAQPGQAGLAPCDVNVDHTLGYHWWDGSAWNLVATAPLPGTVQQNTATIVSADGATLFTFGVDVAGSRVVECAFPVPSGPASCAALPFALAASSNYVGAAISPDGYRLVWWTSVVDGGGGSFHYLVDYGGGWNGPRSGDCAGFNDASYVHVAFPTDAPARFSMHAQLVAGLAPNWTFHGGVGTSDFATPVTFSTPLAAVNGDDPVASTNDVWIDPETQDEHLVARTDQGRAAYYHRPPGGSWSPASFVLDATFRARLVPHGSRLGLVYGPGGGGLAYRVAHAADRPAGVAIDWASLPEEDIALPAGYESIYAIYPGAPPYQLAASPTMDLAVVGAERQNEVLGVTLDPL